jgi:predicted transcriptional regulator
MRTVRKNIALETDSALALMQEIYNDIVEQKNTATLIMKKMLSFMKESEDMSVIGPVIKEQQKILNECTEKKISLVKIQTNLIQKGASDGNKFSPGKLTLSDEDREILDKLVNEDGKNKGGEKYSL